MTNKNTSQKEESLVNFVPPKFSLSLLHPKYWGVWFGFGFIALIVNVLPYRVLYCIGRSLGYLSMFIVKKRVKVAQRNLELCFPEISETRRDHVVKENFKNTGFAIFESAIAWFWPDWRLKKRVGYYHVDRLTKFEKEGRGTLICGVHALNVELTARCCALFSPGYGVYRPHNNPAYNFIQHWGRTRSGNIMVDRKDVKGMLKVLRKGKKLFYLPDHDYGSRKAVFVPFFAVPDACTTTGTSILVDASKCAVLPVSCFRVGFRYDFRIEQDISEDFPHRDPEGAAILMNKTIEKLILRGGDQWMWLHKRFKTMPDGQNKGIRYKD
ncbi:LpxL/LpxP family Kdo(2)-lipid IV(A) lauroyl/palmitoleoyl acyltransferase [Vibrio algivorus]|uniref:Lipid A biosynthesis acyltransferase n=1 Tax=Vibrio algivorus TaxID=1667024 RepID=A0A557P5N3_9VIBR|nr:LpxL/LpxP family Kdo(2)-lipid IV(A) lauroyl/palmitoleoyl acyltransferase [Vibrio algivorus]TVO35937.1 LpxL/LpxP family Kdo(2)-lipid IV(A) lauroyl/palmitoleoyl acyltransferase [Vibrio algivorus]GLT13138.1 lipid A biosynthesis lauroyltransferase [Vibrio algivorus]